MWYEDLNFIENPFKDLESIELIGYGGIVDDLLYNIGASNIVILEGKEGSGKTTLLKAVINKFRGHGRVVYINGDKVKNPNIETILINKNGFFGKFFNVMPMNMILLMDEVENLSEKNLERIKYFYDQNHIRSIIFTSNDKSKINFSPSMKDRVAKIITLRDLNEDEAYRIIKSRLGEVELFSREDIKELFNGSGKNIKNFLENCETVAKLVVEKKMERANKEVMEGVLGKKETKMKEHEKRADKGRKSGKEKSKGKETELKSIEKKTEVKLPSQIKIIYDNT